MERSLHIGLAPGLAGRTAFMVLDGAGNFLDAGFFEGCLPTELVRQIEAGLAAGLAVLAGVDAARHALPRLRYWEWEPTAERWVRLLRGTSAGRHAEIILRAHGFRETRWTDRTAGAASMFQALHALPGTVIYETCAEASFQALDPGSPLPSQSAPAEGSLEHATLAATTSREFFAGRGQEIGGGDGLGTIILPRPLRRRIAGVLEWPDPSDPSP